MYVAISIIGLSLLLEAMCSLLQQARFLLLLGVQSWGAAQPHVRRGRHLYNTASRGPYVEWAQALWGAGFARAENAASSSVVVSLLIHHPMPRGCVVCAGIRAGVVARGRPDV